MGPVAHSPSSYAGVQEALEFLDMRVRRILHLGSFLWGKHVCADTQASEKSAEEASAHSV